MKSHTSSQSFKKRMNELERISARIEAKMTKLEKIIANITENLHPE